MPGYVEVLLRVRRFATPFGLILRCKRQALFAPTLASKDGRKRSPTHEVFLLVIASQCNVGGSGDVALIEAIQFFYKRLDCFVAAFLEGEELAPRNDELRRLILLKSFSASLSG